MQDLLWHQSGIFIFWRLPSNLAQDLLWHQSGIFKFSGDFLSNWTQSSSALLASRRILPWEIDTVAQKCCCLRKLLCIHNLDLMQQPRNQGVTCFGSSLTCHWYFSALQVFSFTGCSMCSVGLIVIDRVVQRQRHEKDYGLSQWGWETVWMNCRSQVDSSMRALDLKGHFWMKRFGLWKPVNWLQELCFWTICFKGLSIVDANPETRVTKHVTPSGADLQNTTSWVPLKTNRTDLYEQSNFGGQKKTHRLCFQYPCKSFASACFPNCAFHNQSSFWFAFVDERPAWCHIAARRSFCHFLTETQKQGTSGCCVEEPALSKPWKHCLWDFQMKDGRLVTQNTGMSGQKYCFGKKEV